MNTSNRFKNIESHRFGTFNNYTKTHFSHEIKPIEVKVVEPIAIVEEEVIVEEPVIEEPVIEVTDLSNREEFLAVNSLSRFKVIQKKFNIK